MKIVRLLSFLLLIAANVAFAQIPNSSRIKFNFNTDWKMWVGDTTTALNADYNDASWKSVTLPHAFNEDDAFKVSIDQLSTGIVWYRKHFSIPKEKSGQKVFLEFEGIRQAGEFFINGKSIGISENGIMAFGFDVTSYIQFGADNVIAARIDNNWNYHEKATKSGFQWNDKNFYANYGGINKNVFLHVTNPLYQTLPLFSNLGTTGVYVYAKDIDIDKKTALITAEAQVKNDYPTAQTFQYQVVVEDAITKKTVANFNGKSTTLNANEMLTVSAAAKVSNLNFWSWGYGYLYNVYTVLLINGKATDVVKTTTGFRKTAFQNGMLILNNRPIQVHGYAQRSTNEWPALGSAVSGWMSDYSNHLMVQSNGNLVRWMHVTPWKQDVESCDRVGLMQAMPAGDSEKDVDGRRWEQRTEVMRDAIIYNRNNPSIIFYESGNSGISEAHMKQMKAIRDTYDPYGGRAIGCRDMRNSKEAEYGGEMLYINKSATKPLWMMEYSRDEGLRKYWDEFSPPFHKDGDGPLHNNQPAAVYNRNQDSHAIENVVRWFEYWHERPGTGERVNGGGVNIIFSESNTHHRGAENYRRSGEVDALRIIKDGFYAHQVIWDGWVDVEKPRAHIIGHWNYQPGVVKDITVISSAEKVALFVNGKPLGFGLQSNRFLYTFKKVAWQPGTIKAIGYDANGKVVCEAAHTTSGNPAAVRLTPITAPNGLLANGADLALVEVEVVDAKGNRCPVALNTINFTLDGPAEWRGGMAQGPDNFILSKTLPVECGVNRVLIRSTRQAGNIVLKATSEGLASATVTIVAKPFAVTNGLSTELPSAGLQPNLERGATPATPSFIVKRLPLKIIGATAGANADKAAHSYDDNELTDWANDGNISNAWIAYEIDQAAPVSEVTLRLNNFRTKSYPLRITVDGKEVYKGVTPHSLGYFTASFKPTVGKIVKIELLDGLVVAEDSSVEVNGKKLGDGLHEETGNAKGKLSIIEAEIYQALH